LTCGLDGQWRESRIAGTRLSCRATWKDRTLVLVERTATDSSVASAGAERTKRLHIDENGSLVMDIEPAAPSPAVHETRDMTRCFIGVGSVIAET
jgi:hypothetical protein